VSRSYFKSSLQFLEIAQWTIVPRAQQQAMRLLRCSELILELRDRPCDVGKQLIVMTHISQGIFRCCESQC